jgi:tetratricopeptide (TPR) repeat protein
MSYAYMELRHYNEAIECLDECLNFAEDKVPDIYFRRSQAKTYNKYSSDRDLEEAMMDIEKALSLKEEIIYSEHKEILEKIISEKKKAEIERTEGKY